MSQIRKLTTKEIFNNNQRRSVPAHFDKVKILLHNIRSMHNVGSVFRSCDAFGISELILTGYTPHPPRAEIAKTALGADQTVPWKFAANFDEIYHDLMSVGYEFIGLEQTNNSSSLIEFKINPDKPVCIILGNEATGIDDELIPYIDRFLEIPQFGEKHSLNVSVTAGIAMYAILEKFMHL